MKPYDLQNYKLTLPCDSTGNLSGSPLEIRPEQLVSGYQGKYFQNPGDGTLTFLCPDGGAHTPGATCARSELRDLREWTVHDAWTDTLIFSVDQLGIGETVIVQQAHDANEPIFFNAVERISDGTLRMKLFAHPKDGGPHASVLMLTGLKLCDKITSTLSFTQKTGMQHVGCRANGFTHGMNMHREGKGGNVYGKRGAYYQCADRKGAVCIVKHH